MELIGFGGYLGTGKSTIASRIRRGVVNPLALLLRMEISSTIAAASGETDEAQLGIDITQYNPPVEVYKAFTKLCTNNIQLLWQKPTDPDVRVLLQWWGTEFRRNQDPDYWIKAYEEKIIKFYTDEQRGYKPTCILIDDVRYKNEFELIKKYNGLFVFLTRDGITRSSDHSSEAYDWYTPGMPNTMEYKLTERDLNNGDYIWEAIREKIDRDRS